jgi:hypothetical protein
LKLLLFSFFLLAADFGPEETLIRQVAESGRAVTVAENPDERVAPATRFAPGPPPMISFRYYEGKLHHRFGNQELMLDDAGH